MAALVHGDIRSWRRGCQCGACFDAYRSRYAAKQAERHQRKLDRIGRRRYQALLANERTVEMVRLYEAGESLRAIAERYGLSLERVRQILWRSGTTIRRRGRALRREAAPEGAASERQSRY